MVPHKANSHLLVQLKAIQAGLLRKAKAIAAHTTPLTQHETVDANRCTRCETRYIKVFGTVRDLRKPPVMASSCI
jgi:hypothetical protein